MVEAFLNVLAIIGIIIAGGFIIYFLGDLVISLVDGKNPTFFAKKKDKNDYIIERPVLRDYEEQKSETLAVQNTKGEDRVIINNLIVKENDNGWKNVDTRQAEIEKRMLENASYEQSQTQEEIFAPFANSSTHDDLRKEEEEFRKKSLEAVLERQNSFKKSQEVVSEKNDSNEDELDFGDIFYDDSVSLKETNDENYENDDEVDVDFEALLAELSSKVETSHAMKEEKEEDSNNSEIDKLMLELEANSNSNNQDDDNQDEEDQLDEDNNQDEEEFDEEEALAQEEFKKKLLQEIEDQKEDIKKLSEIDLERIKIKEELEALRLEFEAKENEMKKLKNESSLQAEEAEAKFQKVQKELYELKSKEPEVVVMGPMHSIEEYEKLLEKLQLRLKENEKELKSVKKEFLPLARVKKSLENDKKKLRRKEAIVAKHKVVLYGVNNYVDIDEDKAKELAEDLDLLDGLKLSVEHCENVMKQNEERYPVLENTFRILKNTNENYKKDIAETLAAIENLNNNNA